MDKPFNFKTLILATGMSALAAQAVHANPMVGERLSDAQLAQYASAPTVQLESQSFKVLGTANRTKAASTPAVTQVVNERGVVGESRNEVIVSQAAVDAVRQAAGGLNPAPVAAEYYEHLDMSTLRFASFQGAVSARAQLKKLLPQARVDVPVRYTRPRAR